MPKRIQRKRTKGWRMPPNTVYVGRPTGWGNPFTAARGRQKIDPANGFYSIDDALKMYRDYLSRNTIPQRAKSKLKGKNLSCWCPLDQPCHADVLLEIANQ